MLAVIGVAIAPPLRAQFTPGPNPITGTVTAAQTIASGTGTIASGGILQVGGSAVAITVTGSSSIVNNGTVNQTGTGRGIRNNTNNLALMVTNNAGATIQTADGDAFQMNTANSSVTFNNYGSVISLNASAGGSQAIDWNAITTASNTLNNYSTGLLKAFEADAVRPGVNGVIYNAGTILSVTSTGNSSDGIDAQNNSGVQITNDATGKIEGGRHGITGGAVNSSVTFTTSVTNNLGGVIQGDNGAGINLDGFNANQSATVINHGTIVGNGVTGDGDGIDSDGLLNLTNTGTVRSVNAFSSSDVALSEGISAGGGTIVNSGTIEGLVAAGNSNALGRGISIVGIDTATPGVREAIYANTVITNQNGGLIRGQSDSGIFVGGPASGFTVTINNLTGATIEGGGTTAAIQTGADNDTINNAGTIKADTSGKAIEMGAGNDVLAITGGSASIIGDVSGGTGANTLTIDPGAGKAFSYGGAFSNFASNEIKSGTVTLSGASTYAGNTTISGGTLVANNLSGSATGSGSVTVASGATLAGNGRIGGDVSVQSGGRVSPGTSAGNLSLDANLTITSGARFLFELGANTAASDRVTVAGAFNFTGNGQAIVDLANYGIVAGNDYSLVFFASSNGLTAANFALGEVPSGFAGSFNVTSNSLVLHVSAVPETNNTCALLALACAMLIVVSFQFRPRA